MAAKRKTIEEKIAASSNNKIEIVEMKNLRVNRPVKLLATMQALCRN